MQDAMRSRSSSSHIKTNNDETPAWRTPPKSTTYSIMGIIPTTSHHKSHPNLPRITNTPPPMRMRHHDINAPPPHLTRYNLRCCNTPMRTRMARSLYRSNLVSSVEVVRYGGDGFVTMASHVILSSATCIDQNTGIMENEEV